MKQTVAQVIDDILLSSPYGHKAYDDRQKRLRDKEKEKEVKQVKDTVKDHPQQLFFDFDTTKKI